MVSSTDTAPTIDPEADSQLVESGAMEVDEMEGFFEVGPDPWLAERVCLDPESDEVLNHHISIQTDD